MRNFVFYIFLVVELNAFAQTKPQVIKVKKDIVIKKLKQSEMPHFVTISNLYNGTISKTDLLMDPVLKISNNKFGLKIIDFEMTYKKRGKLCSYSGLKNDTIPASMKKEIFDIDNRSLLFIHTIRAVSSNNDTLLLNSIELRIID